VSYELWLNDVAHLIPNHLSNGCSLDIRCEKITAQLAGWKKALYWKIASLGKASMYVVRDGNRIVHTSYVVRGGKIYIYGRM